MTHSLNIRGSLYEIKRPQVMGIINVTPDSFYAGSRVDLSELLARVEVMLRDGADMLDLGGYSTRPGAAEVSAEEEVDRLLPAIDKIRSRYEDWSVWNAISREIIHSGKNRLYQGDFRKQDAS